jgi:hypothetical protein
VDADCPTNSCDLTGACRCGGAGECGPGLGCDPDSDLCSTSLCSLPLSMCMPFDPVSSLPSTSCDPIMLSAADQGALVGRVNLSTVNYTRVPLPGAVFDPRATTKTGGLAPDGPLTPKDPHLPVTVRVRPDVRTTGYPAVRLNDSNCGRSDLRLRSAVGRDAIGQVTTECQGGKCDQTPFGPPSTQAIPDTSYVPPYPDRFCGHANLVA